MGRVNKTVERLVYARDDYRCVHCGATEGLSLQHRINAGMGGSKRLHVPSNLIVFCAIENALLESDPRKAKIGRLNGWKLKSYETPSRAPVYYPMLDEWFVLDDTGGRVLVSPVVEVVEDVPF